MKVMGAATPRTLRSGCVVSDADRNVIAKVKDYGGLEGGVSPVTEAKRGGRSSTDWRNANTSGHFPLWPRGVSVTHNSATETRKKRAKKEDTWVCSDSPQCRPPRALASPTRAALSPEAFTKDEEARWGCTVCLPTYEAPPG